MSRHPATAVIGEQASALRERKTLIEVVGRHAGYTGSPTSPMAHGPAKVVSSGTDASHEAKHPAAAISPPGLQALGRGRLPLTRTSRGDAEACTVTRGRTQFDSSRGIGTRQVSFPLRERLRSAWHSDGLVSQSCLAGHEQVEYWFKRIERGRPPGRRRMVSGGSMHTGSVFICCRARHGLQASGLWRSGGCHCTR